MRLLVLAAVYALYFAAAAPSSAQPAQPSVSQRSTDPGELPKVFSVRVTVADLDRAERFYREALGAVRITRVHDHERVAHFASGVDLLLAQGAPVAGVPSQGAGGFIVQVSDIDAVVARVGAAGGVVERAPNSGRDQRSYGVRAAQIRDPDGVGIELIQFPSGGARHP